MRHLSVGIFHDENLGRELGKKGTESDIVLCHKKTQDCIYTFMHPVGDKLSSKTQIIQSIDAAIIVCSTLSAEVGETILLLDAVGINKGLIVVPAFSDTTQMKRLLQDTSLAGFPIVERNLHTIMGLLEQINPERDNTSPPIVVIDHAFTVKGVGEIILGFVKKGVVHKHDKLLLTPGGKEILVRSIQMQDADFETAPAGARVGLALKGASIDELKRGCILCSPGSIQTSSTGLLSFQKNKFYPEVKNGVFHVTVGMQTVPVTITAVSHESLQIQLDRLIGFSKDDTFLLFDLNAKKLHLIGKGKMLSSEV
ncbi:MAG: EF-Tu/IF-2/RF-3 family GTPase [Candidatus Thermoplasmatota archaeon]